MEGSFHFLSSCSGARSTPAMIARCWTLGLAACPYVIGTTLLRLHLGMDGGSNSGLVLLRKLMLRWWHVYLLMYQPVQPKTQNLTRLSYTITGRLTEWAVLRRVDDSYDDTACCVRVYVHAPALG